jgi:hypothetical protein
LRSVLKYAALACVASAVLAAAAVASPPTPDHPAGNILGIVPSHASHNAGGGGGGNLAYHGGPVMHANTVVPIYWTPAGSTVSANYESVINQYFADVSHDSGLSSNVYYAAQQYTDGSGAANYSVSTGAAIVDTNPFPANGCTDSYTSICLSDAQIQAEINRVAGSNRSGVIYFMFTPKGVGSCYDSSHCAFSYYCAYHSSFSSSAGTTLYANMPYVDTDPTGCGTGEHPNGDDADDTLNVTSHEHNETMTDELGNAWYDRRGQEDGDKCAWTFGTALGGTSGALYNQVINGHHYYLQREWSNKSSGCVLTGQ